MTKHRKPEQWIEDILEAASEAIEAEGYANLTMDAVAARSGLSKGGIYRFFASKRDLVSALLDHTYLHAMDFDIDEVVDWNLPIDETFVRVIIDKPTEDPAKVARDDRIWLQIMPQALWDTGLAQRYRQATERFEKKCLALAEKLLERDHIALDEPSRQTLRDAVQMGIMLRDGLAVRTGVTTSVSETADVGRRYVRMTIQQILGERHG